MPKRRQNIKEFKVTFGEDIAQPEIPIISPEKNAKNYIVSKVAMEKVWRFPSWYTLPEEPAVELRNVEIQLYETNQFLDEKRVEYIIRRKQLDAEWEDIGKKENTLRTSFIMFHKFVKDNQEKKLRALRYMEEEENINKRRDEEIVSLGNKIEKLKTCRNLMSEDVKRLEIYENYLTAVTSDSFEHKNIPQVLSRYDTLQAAKQVLINKQKESLEEVERGRANMMELIEERVGVIMTLNTKLADLQTRYEKVKTEALHWETVLYKTKNKSSKRKLTKYLVQESVWNLYQQMCLRIAIPTQIDKKDVEAQLGFIKEIINQFKVITKLALKRMKKEEAMGREGTGYG